MRLAVGDDRASSPAYRGKMGSMLLFLLIIVLAAAAGILGDVLEFALWAIAIMVLFAALLGYLVYRWIERTRDRIFGRR